MCRHGVTSVHQMLNWTTLIQLKLKIGPSVEPHTLWDGRIMIDSMNDNENLLSTRHYFVDFVH